MIYLWMPPEEFHDIGDYDRDHSPDRFLLIKGRKLAEKEMQPLPKVNFKAKKQRILQFDCLPNNSLVPLVNQRVKKLLEFMAPAELQFFPAILNCKDGLLENEYFFVNAIHTILGLDHETSNYSFVLNTDAIMGFKYAQYKPNCLGEHQIARDEEYHMHLLVSEKIKQAFDKEHISGVYFVRPEDWYS